MSVEAVLRKLCDHNADVLGCIASHKDNVYRDLPDMYQLMDADGMREHAENMFTLMDGLDTGADAFDQIFLEYQNHSISARRLEDGVLVLIAKPMARSEFKKTQVGVNLFLKPLKRAFGEVGAAPAPGEQDEVEAEGKPKRAKPGRMYRGVRY